MSSPNHLSTFSEDWNDAASWAEIPAPKPAVSIRPELEALQEDTGVFEDEPELLAPPKIYKQGETIGLNNAPNNYNAYVLILLALPPSDWLQEQVAERARLHKVQGLRGASRLSFTLNEAFQIIIIVTITGASSRPILLMLFQLAHGFCGH